MMYGENTKRFAASVSGGGGGGGRPKRGSVQLCLSSRHLGTAGSLLETVHRLKQLMTESRNLSLLMTSCFRVRRQRTSPANGTLRSPLHSSKSSLLFRCVPACPIRCGHRTHSKSDWCQRKRRKFYHWHVDLRHQGLDEDFSMRGTLLQALERSDWHTVSSIRALFLMKDY